MIRVTRYGPILVFLAAMLWASDAPFRAFLVTELPSSFIVLAEHVIDLIIVLPIIYVFKDQLRNLKTREWLAIIFIGVGGSALASIAFTQSFNYVNPSIAILLQKLQPIIAITGAALILKETFSKKFWAWAILAIFGAYLISFSGLMPRLFVGENFNPNLIGILWAILAVVLWGLSTVLGRFVLAKTTFPMMTALRFVSAFVFLLVLNIWQNTIPTISTVSGKAWLYIIITAVTSGVVSLFIYYRGLQDTKASIASIAELGFPVAAVIINYLVLKDPLSLPQLIGMIILLFSIWGLIKLNKDNKELEYGNN